MHTAENNAMPTPELIFNTLFAYQRSAALNSAIELDVFTAIGAGATKAAALAAKTGCAERGVRILCDYLAIHGLLTKNGNQYGLTPDSAMFLDKHSPACLGSCARLMTSPEFRRNFDDLTAAVRNGGATSEATIAKEWPGWVEFARSMAPMMSMPAKLMAERFGSGEGKLLDIAAGHGLFGIAMAQKNPQLEIVALDWPAVLEVARENAAKAGISGRYQTLPGSAFDVAFGSGYATVLLTNFLHHFDKPTNEALLRKVRGALLPGGKALALEFIPNEDRISPPMDAGFSLVMLAGTPSGDAYTFPELQQMFHNSGFAGAELHELAPGAWRVVAATRNS